MTTSQGFAAVALLIAFMAFRYARSARRHNRPAGMAILIGIICVILTGLLMATGG